MVHRPADSRLLSNLLQQEKDYLKQFNQLFTSSAASLDSFTAYAAASPPPASQVILAVAGLLAAADDALKRYALGVEQWREAMRVLKDMEDDVGNIMRDREILVTRLIKVSKSHKSNSGTFRESLLIGSSRHSSSSLSLSITNQDYSPSTSRPVSTSFTTSTKLAAAQSELQACETHLASKESELALRRSAAVREGLATRAKAMIQCSRVWERIGKEILDSLDDLGIIDAHRNGLLEQRPPTPRDQMPVAGPSSDFSSIGPSQSASQISYPFPEPVTNNAGPEILIQQPTPTAMPRRHSVASVSSARSSLYHAPGTQTTYKVETVTYAPAVSLVVAPPPPSENIPLTSNDSSSFGIGLPPPIGYASETEVHTTMYIPPAHAISENEMPTAKVAAESGGSGSGGSATLMGWRHSRAESVKSQEELAYFSGHQPQPRGRVSSLGASAPAPESTSGPPITTLSHHHHHTSSNINRGVGGEQKAVPITAVGSALIEVFDEPEDIEEDEDEDEEEEDDDDELPVEGEDQLIEQGKLAVVENPRFMSEERRNELEKEREKWMKQPSSDAEKGQQKSEELEPVPVPEPVPEPEPEAKKNFSFLPQRKGAGTQDRVTFAPAVTPSTPKSSPSKGGETLPYTSPSKTSPSKRFLGSLKGFFGGSRASPEVAPSSQIRDSSSSSPPSRFRSEPPLTPFPVVDLNAYHDSDDDDDDDDEYPTTTKTRNGFQTFLWGNGGSGALKKKKDGGSSSATAAGAGTRWSTRTDRNIRKLTKNGGGGGDEDDNEYGTYLSRDVRNNGVAGDIVGKAGLVDGTGPREVKKKRSIGTAGPGGGSPVNGGGGGGGGRKKLKKSVPPPIVTAAPPPSSLRHVISSTPQWNDTTTTVTRDQAHTPANPSTALRKSSVKTGDVPKRRSASVDESVRRGRTSNVVGDVGQTSSAGGVVDLGRRRVSSYVIPSTNAPPVVGAAFARGIPAATRTPAVAAGTSAVSKGYSSDTAAARVARAPPTAVAPPPPAATATPSKPTRQPSAGKTQTHPQTLTNPPPTVVENTGSSRPQPHVLQPSQPQPQPQPQPHRQHSTSSSGGAAIVLTAGATQPTGTLISRPGWDAQALPTGGGLSRNNSVLSGVSGVAGGSSGGGGGAGGMSKKKKQRQTSLGHGMGSGTSLGRRSSLGSSSGHGGGGRPAVQPTPPAQSLMSIIEDVAKHNREWNQESSQLHKNRNRIVSGGGGGGLLEREKKTGPVVGMVDVVKAPRSFGRDELAHLDPAMIKARVMETSTTTTTTTMTTLTPAPAAAASGASGSGGRMVDIKAPGSIFDQRDTTAAGGSAPAAVRPKVYRQVSNSTPDLTQRQQQVNLARRPSGTTLGPAATSTPVSRSKRPAKSPLRSAMKNPSRTPSPLTSPFLVHKQQQAIQEGSRPVVDGLLAPVAAPPAQYSTVLGSQQQSSSHTPSTTAPADIQSTTTMVNGRAASDSASQRRKGKRQVRSAPDEVVGEEAGESTSTNDSENEVFYTDDEDDHDHAVVVSSTGNQGATPMLNGHAVGYTGSSDLSHSTTSTAVHRHPPPTTTSTIQPTATLVARRRKSVRVSLQPTFSPSPPAVEYDKEEQPWVWKQDHHHHHHHHTEGGGGGGQHQQQLHVHAPVPVAASSSLLLNPAHHNHHRQQKVPEPAHDIWEDSDEDVEYQNAKLLLTRAAKKEKDMNVIAARSRS